MNFDASEVEPDDGKRSKSFAPLPDGWYNITVTEASEVAPKTDGSKAGQMLQLKLEIDLSMSDSRPIVAMFSNQGWRPKFLTDMMTVEDIKGKANINMADGRIVIPLAKASGDTMEVDARAVITEQSSNGMVYFRYKNFDALLKIKDGKKNLDIIKPLKKYQAYTVE